MTNRHVMRLMIGAIVATVMGTTVAPATAAPLFLTGPAPYWDGFVRGVYGRDSSSTGVATIRVTGFDTVTAMPDRDDLDTLWAEGMRAVVWLGEYHRTRRCSFEWSDAAVTRAVQGIAGHPAILAYQIADEPNYARPQGCRDAVSDLVARSELVRSLDPGVPTYVTLSTWDGREGYPYQYFASVADIVGLVVYPCSRAWDESGGCRFDMIDTAIAEAERDGIERYWGVIQDFDDGWYRSPSAAELDEQFARWEGSRIEGYFVYHWNHGDIENRKSHRAVLTMRNARSVVERATVQCSDGDDHLPVPLVRTSSTIKPHAALISSLGRALVTAGSTRTKAP